MTRDEAMEIVRAARESGVLPDLRNADLRDAYLWNADLRNADLRDADLRDANLRNADLRDAYLWNADLRDADLSNAYLWNADLRNADLRDAYLWNADLRGANLSNAYLWNANLRNANLRGADLSGTRGAQVLAYTDAGYCVLAVECPGEWRIFAGCRGPWTIDEARAHWSAPDYHTPRSGSRVCAALDWLATQPVPDVLRGEG